MNSTLVSQQTLPGFLAEFHDYAQQQSQNHTSTRMDAKALGQLLQLAGRYFSHYPLEELRGRPMSDVFGGLYQAWRWLQDFDGTAPKIRVFNPSLEQDGWLCPHTVVFILQKDMPFLVDSARIELNRRNIRIYAIKSTVLSLVRDSNGHLDHLATENPSHHAEALIVMEISTHSHAQDLQEIEQGLQSVLREVNQVVQDFQPMKQAANKAEQNLAQARSDLGAANVEETREFIRWLLDDHFTFLGYCEYELVEREGRKYLQEIIEERQGVFVLRAEPRNEILVDEFNEGMARFHLAPQVIAFSKSSLRTRVHRYAYPDYLVLKRFDGAGNVIGEARFLGLFTSEVYLASPWQIPLISAKVSKVFELSGLDKRTHDGKNFRHLLETFPRNEIFLSSSSQLFETLSIVAQINERSMVRLLMRRDPFGKFVNFIVYVPRDNFSTRIRLMIQDLIGKALGTQDCEFTTYLSESVLARVYLVFNVDGLAPVDIDVKALEAGVINITRSWDDHFHAALLDAYGEERAADLLHDYRQGFSISYQENFDARTAVQDLQLVSTLSPEQKIAISIYQPMGFAPGQLQFKLFHFASNLALSDVIPVLENLGFHVDSESAYEIRHTSGTSVWMHDFRLLQQSSQPLDVSLIKQQVIDAFVAIWYGHASNDSFNRLITLANLEWRQVAVLRAYASYMHQTLFPFTETYIAASLERQLVICQQLIKYFILKFDPTVADSAQMLKNLSELIQQHLDKVENLNEDRILRRFLVLLENTLRTNYFQRDKTNRPKEYLSFKLSPRQIPDIPEPRPLYEIFVFSPRMEAVHLRTSKVSRGGLRWSDRLQDYRTEVLGLVKAQQVKNAVIVPSGAKGGFVCKKMPDNAGRDAQVAEAIICYQTMIRGMLDLTDNYVGNVVKAPQQLVRYDGDDPYLVVAADKGTASFSDIANRISEEYQHWLGDAFASGGSQGYDHKGMGITARGAWISVQRHFIERQIDVQTQPITVLGIGDMAGDVFGNGMLLSRAVKLVAAFNHQHIFIDPNPDPEKSFLERQRLFVTPKTTWDYYAKNLISAGGGVFNRSAKSIVITEPMRELLGITAEKLAPHELIHALLKSPVDLIWNGGIGTYVKSATETHADVGDKANDNLRVNGVELRCKVFGEGGNLGMTQRGRIEYCLNGGSCNTDFIDNAGGVDCSDHEVNIKILLDEALEQGDITIKQRNQLLVEMTGDVADLVLRNNFRQTLAISVAQSEALKRGAEYRRFMQWLQTRGRLNRALEYLPDDDVLLERQSRGKSLTRPELSILISYAKAMLKEELVQTDLADDDYTARFIETAFPPQIVSGFSAALARHRLRREIVATQVANDMVNTMGITFAQRLMESAGASVGDIAKAYIIARDIYDVADVYYWLEKNPHALPAGEDIQLVNTLTRKVRRAARWFLRNRRGQLNAAAEVKTFVQGITEVQQHLPQFLSEPAAGEWQNTLQRFKSMGLPDTLVYALIAPANLYSGLSIVDAARSTGANLGDIARLYFTLGNYLHLPWFYAQISDLSVENNWQAMARETYLSDLESQLRSLTITLIQFVTADSPLESVIEKWYARHALLIDRWNLMVGDLKSAVSPDYAIFSVALRDLLDISQATQHCAALDMI